MNILIENMIENGRTEVLDAMQIRGGYETLTTDTLRYVGFDYRNQEWIEHTFEVQ
jgi:hypothetical protein